MCYFAGGSAYMQYYTMKTINKNNLEKTAKRGIDYLVECEKITPEKAEIEKAKIDMYNCRMYAKRGVDSMYRSGEITLEEGNKLYCDIEKITFEIEQLERGEITIKDYIEYSICKNHNDKMYKMLSISTAAFFNEQCQKNQQIEGSICEKCYAEAMQEQYFSLRVKLEQNTIFYNKYEIAKNDVPFINAAFFRFEAFGDLNSPLQFKNYMTIAKYNKHCNFAIWTKNPQIIKTALQLYGNIIPKNVVIIYSSLFINKQIDLEKIKKIYPFIEKTFTVYSDYEVAAEYGKKVNCGGVSCINCGCKCYKHSKNAVENERIEVVK